MSPPSHHVAMMQIDCQVMNTKLIHVNENTIPVNLGASGRSDAGARHQEEAESQQGGGRSNSTSHYNLRQRQKP